LPTSAYIGGPAEIAYFAQSAVLYERILGRLTPVLAPAVGDAGRAGDCASCWTGMSFRWRRFFAQHGRVAGAAAGGAGDAGCRQAASGLGRQCAGWELTALTGYLGSLDEGLGRSAQVSASKMRYQMNRLRRMAANFELQKEASLGRHAQAVVQALYPHGGLQERLIGAAYFLARYGDAGWWMSWSRGERRLSGAQADSAIIRRPDGGSID
jgi:hypothetical protein